MNHAHQAATAYAASTPRLAGKFPDNDLEELWTADIKACVPGGTCQVFRDVMFVEAQGAAYIFGIENEGKRPAKASGPKSENGAAADTFL